MNLYLHQIRQDGGTQPREAIDPEVVKDYSAAMVEGDLFPPVVVYHDGTDYWLADGFHRVRAAEDAGFMEIDAQILMGGQRSAIMHSLGANSMHGLRRTNADKRRAVLRMLEDYEWSQWSNRQIANCCAVDEGLVRKLRPDVTADNPQSTRRTGKDGRTIDTANIGKSKEAEPDTQPREFPPYSLKGFKPVPCRHDDEDHAESMSVFREQIAAEQARRKAEKPEPVDFASINNLVREAAEQSARREAFKERIRISHEGKDDQFADALIDYLDELPNDSRRIEACHNIIKIAKGVANQLHQVSA